MNNIIKLVTKDSVSINNREFTRVMGDTWKWVSMGYTEPYIKVAGM